VPDSDLSPRFIIYYQIYMIFHVFICDNELITAPTSRSKNTANGFNVKKSQFNIDF